uniref:Secreted protein n=1 Tax=Anguilla anguilla TaxID=7936 RepID=A0A0E9UPP0_ANGAN
MVLMSIVFCRAVAAHCLAWKPLSSGAESIHLPPSQSRPEIWLHCHLDKSDKSDSLPFKSLPSKS